MTKGQIVLSVTALGMLLICAELGREIWNSVELDSRSDAFEHHVDASLMSSRTQARELFPLIDDVINRPAAFVCVVPPYADEVRVGQLASADLGDDESWLGGPTEQWLGLVILDHENEVIQILRLNFARFRLVAGRVEVPCCARVDRPKILGEKREDCSNKNIAVCLRKIIVAKR
ncbi:hypothetical protein [Dongia sp.]|uniref:hypothetical protein n=1 Tax=Dongia sp. TaxID=1977262 RepID=UPI0034A5C7BA